MLVVVVVVVVAAVAVAAVGDSRSSAANRMDYVTIDSPLLASDWSNSWLVTLVAVVEIVGQRALLSRRISPVEPA